MNVRTLKPQPTATKRPVRLERIDDDPLIALIARLMDSAFVVPGTKIRFGLDSLIGLFPGFGDAAGTVVSLFLLVHAQRQGVPRIVLARMAGNILINSAGGAVPVAGDVFSVFFRSNERNLELLRKHSGPRRQATATDWAFVIGLIALVVLIVALLVLGIVSLVKMIAGAGA